VGSNIAQELGGQNCSVFLLKPWNDVQRIPDDHAEICAVEFTVEWKDGLQYWWMNVYEVL
jgi:hypothetical protein